MDTKLSLASLKDKISNKLTELSKKSDQKAGKKAEKKAENKKNAALMLEAKTARESSYDSYNSRGGDYNNRDSRGDYNSRDRGDYNNRSERGSYGDRPSRGGRGDSRGSDRGRGGRGSYGSDRGSERSYGSDRNSYGSERNSYGSDRGGYNSRGSERGGYNSRGSDRGNYGSRGSDRGNYGSRGSDRGSYSNNGSDRNSHESRSEKELPKDSAPAPKEISETPTDSEKKVLPKKKSKKFASILESEKEDTDVLRREALLLGASEEDLKLLQDLEDGDSEQEFTGETVAIGETFSNDLSKFMKDIGLGGEAVVIPDADVEEEEQEEEDDEEEEDEESEDEIAEEAEAESEVEDLEAPIEVAPHVADAIEESDEEEVESTVFKAAKPEKKFNPDKITNLYSVDSSKLTVPPRIDWYNIEVEAISNPVKLDRFARERLLERAKTLMEKENKTYLVEFALNNSQKKFLSQILSDGTLNDKISALTLMVQEAPLHNMKAFDTLLGYCEKKSRTASLQAINAMKDLLINGLLPDRKLVAFEKQELSESVTDVQLALAYFEDYLKKSYFKVVSVLETLSHDPILHVRMNVVSHLFDLLKAKPEQEANLLRLGINKLGDVDNKIAAKTSHQILQLEQAHPAMKQIVTDSVIDVIFKTGTEYTAQYYAITTLNQTILTRREEELANSLVKTYFALFEKVLVETDSFNVDKPEDKTLGQSEKGRKDKRKGSKKGKKGGKSIKIVEKDENELVEERNTKLFSALLTGLNRSFPFSNLPSETFQKHLDTLFKITHSTNFNTSVQALVLVNHIITEQSLDTGRYYKTLYESLLDSRLVISSKQGIYLNLLFKSLKSDTKNKERVLAFVKRILQVCSHWINVGAITGMLFLLMELTKLMPEIKTVLLERKKEVKEETDVKEEGAEVKSETVFDTQYDPRKRDPQYAHAENSDLWELNQFLNHYHPTVAIYAQSILDSTPQPKPDLGLYTLSHFLDRFVYKNAKQKITTKGSSIMQPLGGAHTGSLLVRSTGIQDSAIPANTVDWLNKRVDQIRPDEKFFHQYFSTRQDKVVREKLSSARDEEEAEEEHDEEVWQALVKSKPDVEAESDDDLNFSDLSGMSDDDEEEQEGEQAEVENASESDEDDFVDAKTSFADQEEEIFGINEEDELDDEEMDLKLGEDDEEESEDEEDEEQKNSKKRSIEDAPEKKSKKKAKNLPVFASADDYAQYLDSDDDDYS